jgi:hypothetical protein
VSLRRFDSADGPDNKCLLLDDTLEPQRATLTNTDISIDAIMPLHLLGKKSWNVYNTDSIVRVRRDEAEAEAREQAKEQALNEADSARRLALLRGEEPPLPSLPIPALSSAEDAEASTSRKRDTPANDDGVSASFRKRRRLKGEDESDAAIRHAREDAEFGERIRQRSGLKQSDERDAPLTDHVGHLQLIPAPDEASIRKAEKNAEAEAEKAKKRKREEDLTIMRFSNAAGYNNGMQKPWYAGNASALSDVPSKDVWGNDDPLRKERERNRITTNDPFAAMQQAQRQLKQSERDREKWNETRKAEIEELKRVQAREERHRERKHRRRREEDEDSLEGFSLDASEQRREGDGHDRRKRRRHRHHRDRSRSRSPDRHRRSRHDS